MKKYKITSKKIRPRARNMYCAELPPKVRCKCGDRRSRYRRKPNEKFTIGKKITPRTRDVHCAELQLDGKGGERSSGHPRKPNEKITNCNRRPPVAGKFLPVLLMLHATGGQLVCVWPPEMR